MKFNCTKVIKKVVFRFIISVLLVTTILSLLTNSFFQSLHQSKIFSSFSNRKGFENECDLFSGSWVPFSKHSYYTNATDCVIDDRQNCMKFGRPDTEFLKWRWEPDECELPLFDAAEFLKIVRGKSMAFVGDSLARNHMQSLVCLLATVDNPVDVSYVQDTRFRRWRYVRYNFTLAALWSTHLVKSYEADPNGYSLYSLMNLYLDEPDEAWASQVEHFDYVIISAGSWFSRPIVYYENDAIVGCHVCHQDHIPSLSRYYGYRKAFRTAFKTLMRLKNFKGVTILRTISPPHYENGEWNKGGTCSRRKPFGKEEVKLEGYILEFYQTQVEELRRAEREGRRKGLRFMLLDTTQVMLMRPDGHPNFYGGRLPNEIDSNMADCVHWCLPGPIDTWNEFLLQMLKMAKAKN